jgi:hypothetical protein
MDAASIFNSHRDIGADILFGTYAAACSSAAPGSTVACGDTGTRATGKASGRLG